MLSEKQSSHAALHKPAAEPSSAATRTTGIAWDEEPEASDLLSGAQGASAARAVSESQSPCGPSLGGI